MREPTRDELDERAQELGVEGRSSMDKRIWLRRSQEAKPGKKQDLHRFGTGGSDFVDR